MMMARHGDGVPDRRAGTSVLRGWRDACEVPLGEVPRGEVPRGEVPDWAVRDRQGTRR